MSTQEQVESTEQEAPVADMGTANKAAPIVVTPIVAAPMAGGPSTPELAAAVSRAGGIGMLAAGYLSVEQLQADISSAWDLVGDATANSGANAVDYPLDYPLGAAAFQIARSLGVNLFVPAPDLSDDTERTDRWHEYAERLGRYYGSGTTLNAAIPPRPHYSDDAFAAKVAAVAAAPINFVTFTFGLPDETSVAKLKDAGKIIGVSVTNSDDALKAIDAGADVIIAQGAEAGGHQATFSADAPEATVSARELTSDVVAVVRREAERLARPIAVIAAGGVAGPGDVQALLDAGADAVQVGTLFLAADEAGTKPTHKNALLAAARGTDPKTKEADSPTVVTRAFTGRNARALRNGLANRFTSTAPAIYPELHFLTAPIRKAAAADDDKDALNLWAGTGFAALQELPAAEIVAELNPR